MKYLALLRGINVGGQKKILMKDLQLLFEELDFGKVSTYIQSGNVVFESLETDKQTIKQKIEAKILEKYHFEVIVLIYDLAEMENIISKNPFASEDQNMLYVIFLETEILPENINKIDKNAYFPEEFEVMDKVIYFLCPIGYGKTKLNNNFFEKKFGVRATTRNWKSSFQLYQLLEKL